MRLTKKAQVTLFGLCVFGLILSGTGYAQAKSTQAAYEEQSKQMELYKQELKETQNYKNKLMNFLNEKHLASLP